MLVSRVLMLNLAAIHTSSLVTPVKVEIFLIRHSHIYSMTLPRILSILAHFVRKSKCSSRNLGGRNQLSWKWENWIRLSKNLWDLIWPPEVIEIVILFWPLVGSFRKVKEPFTFSNGVTIPAGNVLATPTGCIHMDDSIYEHACEFDGFRFVNRIDRQGENTKHYSVTTSPDYLVFGHGKHAWYRTSKY